MIQEDFISICIPAYKRASYLIRLLDSICIQSWKHFEVVVTDDSPDDSVKQVCDLYAEKLPLNYYKNTQPLGTPENWNETIRHSKGNWIKIMHDDDWFTHQNSLQTFISEIQKDDSVSFVFSAYTNIYPEGHKTKRVLVNWFRFKLLQYNPVTLISSNVVGPPSCVLFKKGENLLFDDQMKWLVDLDFYIRYLSEKKLRYIPQSLINIGISNTQVTQVSFNRPDVEIPEYFRLLQKIGVGQLGNLLVFDAWWRLIRNLRIRNVDQIREAGYIGEIPSKIKRIIRFQGKMPSILLFNKIGSKLFMGMCFLVSRLE